MSDKREWTEYVVRCRRWVRDVSGEKVWETVDLNGVSEEFAREMCADLAKKRSALEEPRIFVRTVTERELKR